MTPALAASAHHILAIFNSIIPAPKAAAKFADIPIVDVGIERIAHIETPIRWDWRRRRCAVVCGGNLCLPCPCRRCRVRGFRLLRPCRGSDLCVRLDCRERLPGGGGRGSLHGGDGVALTCRAGFLRGGGKCPLFRGARVALSCGKGFLCRGFKDLLCCRLLLPDTGRGLLCRRSGSPAQVQSWDTIFCAGGGHSRAARFERWGWDLVN